MNEYISRELSKTAELMGRLRSSSEITDTIEAVAERCIEAYKRGGKVLLAGNGGSAADAQHIAGELVSKLAFDRPALAAIALTVDTSVLTAIGNDYGFGKVFERQVASLGQPGDVLIAISTSGRSPNIVNALLEAQRKGIVCIGFTGLHGGDMPRLCEICLRIPSDETPKIQEGHIVAAHIVCGLIEGALFGDAGISGIFGSIPSSGVLQNNI